jgi:class 3 adenylate cyclase
VIGDVVNTASRLEALATPGHVLLPRDMLPAGLSTMARSLHLKGKAAAVEVVEIGA